MHCWHSRPDLLPAGRRRAPPLAGRASPSSTAASQPFSPPAADATPPNSLRIGKPAAGGSCLRSLGPPGAGAFPRQHVPLHCAASAKRRSRCRQALLQSLLLRLVLNAPPRRVQLPVRTGQRRQLAAPLSCTCRRNSAGHASLCARTRSPRDLAHMSEQITRVAQNRLRNVYPTVQRTNTANPDHHALPCAGDRRSGHGQTAVGNAVAGGARTGPLRASICWRRLTG